MANRTPKKTDACHASQSSLEDSPLTKLMQAFMSRLEHIVEVIDDALSSENLRDRIWAVEQMLKRLKIDDKLLEPKTSDDDENALNQLGQLSPTQLMRRIDDLLKGSGHE